jgi:hypothetical protein
VCSSDLQRHSYFQRHDRAQLEGEPKAFLKTPDIKQYRKKLAARPQPDGYTLGYSRN